MARLPPLLAGDVSMVGALVNLSGAETLWEWGFCP